MNVRELGADFNELSATPRCLNKATNLLNANDAELGDTDKFLGEPSTLVCASVKLLRVLVIHVGKLVDELRGLVDELNKPVNELSDLFNVVRKPCKQLSASNNEQCFCRD